MSIIEVAALVGAFGGIIGGIVMPFVLFGMRGARQERGRAFQRIEEHLKHLDECLGAKAETLRNQINGVHLEMAREYVTRPEFRELASDLRNEIDAGHRLRRIEDAVRRPGPGE